MGYTNYFYGMHYGWWVIWGLFLFWIFAIPYNIPGQRYQRETALDILKRRLASGDITNEEYLEKNKILASETEKSNK